MQATTEDHVRYLNQKTSLELFVDLWNLSLSPTVWCELFAHPLHRVCPVILNYNNLPEPFKKIAEETEHIGENGLRVRLTPEECFKCVRNILNGGVCDPV